MQIKKLMTGMAGLGLILTMGIGTTATAATESSSARSDVAKLKAAGIDVSRLAPGWTLHGGDISWDGGAVMASIVPMAASDCDSGYVCFWEDKDFTGRRLQFRDTGLRRDMRDYSFNDKMSSWRNRRGLDARWYYDYGGTGTSRCMESGTMNSDVGAGWLNTDNDEMSSFRIYGNDTSC